MIKNYDIPPDIQETLLRPRVFRENELTFFGVYERLRGYKERLEELMVRRRIVVLPPVFFREPFLAAICFGFYSEVQEMLKLEVLTQKIHTFRIAIRFGDVDITEALIHSGKFDFEYPGEFLVFACFEGNLA